MTGLTMSYGVLPSCTRSDWVFLGLTWSLPRLTGPTESYHVLPGPTGLTGYSQVLPGFSGSYRVLPGLTWSYHALTGLIGSYQVLSGLVNVVIISTLWEVECSLLCGIFVNFFHCPETMNVLPGSSFFPLLCTSFLHFPPYYQISGYRCTILH